ncbi:GGDEF domain-containing protein [Variovorax sp. PAMC 28711]|uniref:GGDEF domain-containing protein n=1 Tax=Variovorax sp. PAMC 28711 TaxID=1795631 RepID=UPI00078BCEFC|nr:GGDEF domain-containing protein [Variovorax sp. PAMC 28711]AMM23903.1 hypothetical protein AX767_05740 [Variovorax sp. PAMC 28711]
MALALGVGIYLFATRRFFVRTDRVVLTLLLPLAIVTVMQAFRQPVTDLSHARFAAILVVVAAFFPIGLLLLQSVGAVLLVLVSCTVGALVQLPAETHGATLGFAGLLLSTAVLSAVGAYFREHSQREQFLLHELLSRQAYIDPLTGLQNRRGTDHLTQIARLQAIREGVGLSFVVIEIDHFSRHHERFGHEAGDATLMQVTKILGAFARRPLDVASRLGGNTFGVLLYDCRLEQALLHAEQLRNALHAVRLDHGEGEGEGEAAATLTTHMGAVELQDDEKAEDFYRRADRLLDASRRAGRDRVTIR